MKNFPALPEDILRVFLDYLSVEKGLSSNSVLSYSRDVKKLFLFFHKEKIHCLKAEEEDLISVRPRDPEDRRVNLTQKQSRVILYVGVIFLPVAIFALGIGVYVRRK